MSVNEDGVILHQDIGVGYHGRRLVITGQYYGLAIPKNMAISRHRRINGAHVIISQRHAAI